jgi:RNA polymerase sigma-70 factor (ECF subfamily)
LLEDYAATEDIFQETWLTVIRKIRGLKDIESFPPWLYKIARNKVYQQLRRNRTPLELNENLVVANDASDEDFSAEDAARIHQCLSKLSPAHKEVLMLRFLEQMSYEQMAKVIDCSVGTVRSRVHYAKLALKKEMEK